MTESFQITNIYNALLILTPKIGKNAENLDFGYLSLTKVFQERLLKELTPIFIKNLSS